MGPRFFRHGELPLVVLALLERRPMHGYQLIAELESLFGGRYVPSTGTVYPAVRALAEHGLVSSRSDDRRAVISITPEGRRTLEGRGEQLAEVEARTGVRVRAGEVDAELDRLARLARRAARRRADAAVDVLRRASQELEGMALATGRDR